MAASNSLNQASDPDLELIRKIRKEATTAVTPQPEGTETKQKGRLAPAPVTPPQEIDPDLALIRRLRAGSGSASASPGAPTNAGKQPPASKATSNPMGRLEKFRPVQTSTQMPPRAYTPTSIGPDPKAAAKQRMDAAAARRKKMREQAEALLTAPMNALQKQRDKATRERFGGLAAFTVAGPPTPYPTDQDVKDAKAKVERLKNSPLYKGLIKQSEAAHKDYLAAYEDFKRGGTPLNESQVTTRITKKLPKSLQQIQEEQFGRGLGLPAAEQFGHKPTAEYQGSDLANQQEYESQLRTELEHNPWYRGGQLVRLAGAVIPNPAQPMIAGSYLAEMAPHIIADPVQAAKDFGNYVRGALSFERYRNDPSFVSFLESTLDLFATGQGLKHLTKAGVSVADAVRFQRTVKGLASSGKIDVTTIQKEALTNLRGKPLPQGEAPIPKALPQPKVQAEAPKVSTEPPKVAPPPSEGPNFIIPDKTITKIGKSYSGEAESTTTNPLKPEEVAQMRADAAQRWEKIQNSIWRPPAKKPAGMTDAKWFNYIEQETEKAVLQGKIVAADPTTEAGRRAAVVPLRWGSPRVLEIPDTVAGRKMAELVRAHEEPFPAAKLWRFKYDPAADIAILKPSRQTKAVEAIKQQKATAQTTPATTEVGKPVADVVRGAKETVVIADEIKRLRTRLAETTDLIEKPFLKIEIADLQKAQGLGKTTYERSLAPPDGYSKIEVSGDVYYYKQGMKAADVVAEVKRMKEGAKQLSEYTQGEWAKRGETRDRLVERASKALQDARGRGEAVSYNTEGDFSGLTPELRSLFEDAHKEILRVRALESEAMSEAKKFGATSTRVLDDPQFIETLHRERQTGAKVSTEPTKESSGYFGFEPQNERLKTYAKLKESHPDSILLQRVGDFYEAYGKDAETLAKKAEITLTGRGEGDQRVAMAGVPFHSIEKYLAKLLKKGIKVALADENKVTPQTTATPAEAPKPTTEAPTVAPTKAKGEKFNVGDETSAQNLNPGDKFSFTKGGQTHTVTRIIMTKGKPTEIEYVGFTKLEKIKADKTVFYGGKVPEPGSVPYKSPFEGQPAKKAKRSVAFTEEDLASIEKQLNEGIKNADTDSGNTTKVKVVVPGKGEWNLEVWADPASAFIGDRANFTPEGWVKQFRAANLTPERPASGLGPNRDIGFAIAIKKARGDIPTAVRIWEKAAMNRDLTLAERKQMEATFQALKERVDANKAKKSTDKMTELGEGAMRTGRGGGVSNEGLAASRSSGPTVQAEPITGKGAKPLRDIVLKFGQEIGMRPITGKGARRSIGTYYPSSGAVTVRFAGDLTTTAHEVAHALDDKYNIVGAWSGSRVKSPFDAELRQPAFQQTIRKSYKLSQKRAEGVAEWVRAWIVNPAEAERLAPKFAEHFKKSVGPDTLKALSNFSKDVREFAGASPHEKIMANVRWVPPKNGFIEWATRGKGMPGGRFEITWADRLKTLFVDALTPFDKAVEFAKGERGLGDLLPARDPMTLARLFAGLHAKMDTIFEKGMVNAKLQKVTPGGLKWLLEPLDNTSAAALDAEMQQVISYMIAERTQATGKMSGIGGGVYNDAAVAAARIEELAKDPAKLKRIQDAASRYRLWANSLLDYMEQKGRISAEAVKTIKRNNEQYVAMKRVMETAPGEEFVIQRRSGGKSIGALGEPIQKFKGSSRTIENPYDSLVEATYKTVREADRNQILQAVRDLYSGGRGMYEGEPIQFADVARRGKSGDKNTVKIYVDGKPEVWQFHADVYRTLKGIEEGAYNLPKAVTFIPSVLRWSVTHSPDFAVRNVIRDAIHRGVISDVGSVPTASFVKKNPVNRERFELSGGDQAGHYLQNRVEYNKRMTAAVRELANGEFTLKIFTKQSKMAVTVKRRSIIADVRRLPLAAGKQYLKWVEASERSGRLSEFEKAFDHAKSQGMDDLNAALFASSRARGLMDFAVAGTTVRIINQVIPFTNAAIQGIRATVRAGARNPRAFMARWGIYVLAPTMFERLINEQSGSQDEYEQLPAYQKDLFWNFKVAPDTWLRIPKPFEIGIFASGANRLISHVQGRENAFEGYGGSLARSMIPIDETALTGGPIGVLGQAIDNYDRFRGRPIVSKWEEGQDLELRKNADHASRIGIFLGKLLGIDPRKIDFTVRGMFGGMGSGALNLSDIGRKDRRGPDLGMTGLVTSSPVSAAKDVDWVFSLAERRNLLNSTPIKNLKSSIRNYNAAPTKEERDRKGRQVRVLAAAIRRSWEKSNKGK